MYTEMALVEAILFMESEPRDENTLARIAGISRDVLEVSLEKLAEKYEVEHSGLSLAHISGGWALIVKKDCWDYLKEHYGKKENRLSRAALETLTLVAYSQPITRAEIEAIRGVYSADTMIRLLLERSLIREVGKKDVPGKPIQYGTTKEFLKY
ncbi:MAG: SMC-Scp complex subunit ScpB, partial [Spirochaetaceae bacterium]|nr:SMC-Scp complex subunit ScpB [Spirochaetaceae bacterium]